MINIDQGVERYRKAAIASGWLCEGLPPQEKWSLRLIDSIALSSLVHLHGQVAAVRVGWSLTVKMERTLRVSALS